MGVDLGGRYGAVAQERLDIPYVHPGLQQRRGEGVAEHMGRDVACGPDALKAVMYDAPDGLRGHGSSAAIDKDGVLRGDLGGIPGNVCFHKLDQLRRGDLNDPLLSPLPPDQQAEAAVGQGHRLRRERAQLRDPQARAEQKLQHHDVQKRLPAGGVIAVVGALQEPPDRLLRDGPGKLLRVLDLHMKLIEGVRLKRLVKRQFAEKCPHAGQLALHGPWREAAVQVRDISVQRLPLRPAFPGKFPELPKVDAVRLQRVGGELFAVLAAVEVVADQFW